MLKKSLIFALCFSLIFPVNIVLAAPSGGKVVQGQANINQSGTQTTINQSSNRAIVNWKNFDINKNESVIHNMPSRDAAALHRVTGGGGASQLAGELKSNGNIFLVNPAGVVIHKGAKIDTGGLMATTHDIANEDFMKGNHVFNKPGQPGAAVINQGNITVRDQGFAALVAPTVRNEGVIAAKLGKVALASGDTFKLDFYGDDLINFTVPESTVDRLHTTDGTPIGVENSGTIKAEGGVVLLSATQLDGVVSSVVNNSGTVSVSSAELKGGRIVFGGEGENVDVKNTGAVAASSEKSDGGVVRMVADGGVRVSGTVEAKGANKGGQVDVSGKKKTVIADATITTEGKEGGLIRLGGEFQGGKKTASTDTALYHGFAERFPHVQELRQTQSLYMDNASSIHAGDDGTLIMWSDGATAVYGNLSAKYLELSGKDLTYGGTQHISDGGMVLLDPTDIIIGNYSGPASESITSSTISASWLSDQSRIGGSMVALIVQATNSLTVAADLNFDNSHGYYAEVFLQADNLIKINDGITIRSNDNNFALYPTSPNAEIYIGNNVTIDVHSFRAARFGALEAAKVTIGNNTLIKANGEARVIGQQPGAVAGESGGSLSLRARDIVVGRGTRLESREGILIEATNRVSLQDGVHLFSGTIDIHGKILDIGSPSGGRTTLTASHAINLGKYMTSSHLPSPFVWAPELTDAVTIGKGTTLTAPDIVVNAKAAISVLDDVSFFASSSFALGAGYWDDVNGKWAENQPPNSLSRILEQNHEPVFNIAIGNNVFVAGSGTSSKTKSAFVLAKNISIGQNFLINATDDVVIGAGYTSSFSSTFFPPFSDRTFLAADSISIGGVSANAPANGIYANNIYMSGKKMDLLAETIHADNSLIISGGFTRDYDLGASLHVQYANDVKFGQDTGLFGKNAVSLASQNMSFRDRTTVTSEGGIFLRGGTASSITLPGRTPGTAVLNAPSVEFISGSYILYPYSVRAENIKWRDAVNMEGRQYAYGMESPHIFNVGKLYLNGQPTSEWPFSVTNVILGYKYRENVLVNWDNQAIIDKQILQLLAEKVNRPISIAEQTELAMEILTRDLSPYERKHFEDAVAMLTNPEKLDALVREKVDAVLGQLRELNRDVKADDQSLIAFLESYLTLFFRVELESEYLLEFDSLVGKLNSPDAQAMWDNAAESFMQYYETKSPGIWAKLKDSAGDSAWSIVDALMIIKENPDAVVTVVTGMSVKELQQKVGTLVTQATVQAEGQMQLPVGSVFEDILAGFLEDPRTQVLLQKDGIKDQLDTLMKTADGAFRLRDNLQKAVDSLSYVDTMNFADVSTKQIRDAVNMLKAATADIKQFADLLGVKGAGTEINSALGTAAQKMSAILKMVEQAETVIENYDNAVNMKEISNTINGLGADSGVAYIVEAAAKNSLMTSFVNLGESMANFLGGGGRISSAVKLTSEALFNNAYFAREVTELGGKIEQISANRDAAQLEITNSVHSIVIDSIPSNLRAYTLPSQGAVSTVYPGFTNR